MGISSFELAIPTPNEKERERAVEQSGLLTLLGDATLQSLIGEARRALGTAVAAITVIYRNWQYLIAADGLPTGPYSRHTSLCGHAIHHPDGILVVKDARRDERFAGNPAMEGPGLRFYAGAPLLSADGLPLGVFCIVDRDARDAFSAAEIATLRRFADETMRYARTVVPAAA